MTGLHTRLVGTEIIVLNKTLLPVVGPLTGPKQLGEGLHPSSFTGDFGVSLVLVVLPQSVNNSSTYPHLPSPTDSTHLYPRLPTPTHTYPPLLLG